VLELTLGPRDRIKYSPISWGASGERLQVTSNVAGSYGVCGGLRVADVPGKDTVDWHAQESITRVPFDDKKL
jgi:hypothetical protein